MQKKSDISNLTLLHSFDLMDFVGAIVEVIPFMIEPR